MQLVLGCSQLPLLISQLRLRQPQLLSSGLLLSCRCLAAGCELGLKLRCQLLAVVQPLLLAGQAPLDISLSLSQGVSMAGQASNLITQLRGFLTRRISLGRMRGNLRTRVQYMRISTSS